MARFGVAGSLRTPYTCVAGGVLLAMTFLGLYSSARRGVGWQLSPAFLGDGALVAAVFGIRSGLVEQRAGGLQAFLRMNLLSPVEHMAGAVASLLAIWLILCGSIFVLALVLPGGGFQEATWEAWLFAVRTLPLLPFVIMTESVAGIQLPFFIPALVYFGLLLVLVALLGQEAVVAVVAPPVARGDLGSTLPRLVRAITVAVPGFLLVLLGTRMRSQRRSPRGNGRSCHGAAPDREQ